MKVRSPSPVKNISTVDPHRACASFVYTSQRIHPLRSMAKCKKPEFRSLLAELGHFLTSDVILKENFCRLASIWLIGLMKLFALGRTDLAAARKFRLVGKAENFTEKVVILLRIFEFCRRRRDALRATLGAYVQYRWCRCWTPLFVYTLSRAVLVGVVCADVWCSWYHRDTEHFIIYRLHLLTEVPSGLLFLLPNCSNYCQQSTRIPSW